MSQDRLALLALVIFAVVNVSPANAQTGTSIDQTCACGASWKNHGDYVSCVAKAAQTVVPEEQRLPVVQKAATSSCGNKSDSVSSILATTTQVVSAVQGGTLSLPSGEKLVIPPGALSNDTSITLRTVKPAPTGTVPTSDPITSPLPEGYTGASPIVELLPDGLPFPPDLPALLTIPTTTQDLTNATDLIYFFSDSKWIPVPSISDIESPDQGIDPATRTITTSLAHFSDYRVLLRNAVKSWWSQAVGVVGTIIEAPFDEFSKCRRCRTRPTPISRIIVHSTNNNPKQTFPELVAWIIGTLGLGPPPSGTKEPDEAFFATYYIDQDGRIARLVAEDVQTSHIANYNTGSIGIELFDDISNWQSYTSPVPPRTPAYTSKQLDALKMLVQDLKSRHNVPDGNVCLHRDFDRRLDHQDPYKWSRNDAQNFYSSLNLLPCTVLGTGVLHSVGTGTGFLCGSGPINQTIDEYIQPADFGSWFSYATIVDHPYTRWWLPGKTAILYRFVREEDKKLGWGPETVTRSEDWSTGIKVSGTTEVSFDGLASSTYREESSNESASFVRTTDETIDLNTGAYNAEHVESAILPPIEGCTTHYTSRRTITGKVTIQN